MLDDDRTLLRRTGIALPGTAAWIPPGGGVEDGESPLEALRRALPEERGFVLDGACRHTQAAPEVLLDEALAAENISGFRWRVIEAGAPAAPVRVGGSAR